MTKKSLFSVLLLTFVFAGLHAQTLDASRLTDNLSRSVSLSNLFFGRFSGYVNELYYNVDEYDEFKPSYFDTSLNARLRIKSSVYILNNSRFPIVLPSENIPTDFLPFLSL